jgi:hypothetical protein
VRSFIKKGDEEFNNDFYYDYNFISAYTSFLTQQPTNCNIQAITKAEVCYITYRQLQELIATDVEWLRLGKYVSDIFLCGNANGKHRFCYIPLLSDWIG